MKRIVLDTNFLMIPAQFKVDIFSELNRLMIEPYEMFAFDSTIDELEKISSGKRKDRNAAKVALQLIKQKNLKRLHNSIHGYTDDFILEGVTNKDIVCTQDLALKRRLKIKHKGIAFINLKSKKYLDFE